MQISPAKVAKLPAPAPEDPEPSLGDVRFDEWFETPVFESDADERLEELAMSRRGPMRLAASALLRVNARADRSSRRPARRSEPVADFYDSALWADEAEDPWWPAEDPAGAEAPAPDGAPVEAGLAGADAPAAPARRRGSGAADRPAAKGKKAPAVATEPRRGFRGRVSSALDRWAEMEAQTQYRLERLMLPKRWQS